MFKPLQPNESVHIHRGSLPHWRQDGVTYFVTGRLGDSMPQTKLKQWQHDRDQFLHAHQVTNPDDLEDEIRNEFHAKFTKAWHEWLDAGYGSCVLRRPEIRQLLIGKILPSSETSRYELDAWVIMPNHFHAVLTPTAAELGDILRSWKGGSAHAINRALNRQGSLWQSEPYDHILRSEEQLRHYRRYIADNPIKAKLGAADYAVGIGGETSESAEALKKLLEL